MERLNKGVRVVGEFASSNPVVFALSIVWLITIFLVFLRDRSWSATVRDMERALASVEFDKNRLLDQMSGPDGGDINEFCKIAFEVLQQSAANTVEAVKKEIPNYLGFTALLQIVFLLSCILFEFHLLYSGINLKDAGKNVNVLLIVQTLNFLSKYHPITSLCLGVYIIAKSSLAWLGFFNRNDFVHEMFRWMLSYYFAGLIGYIINSLAGAGKYLPKDWNGWKESVQQSSWWMWLVSRAFGLHNPALAGGNLLWLALKTFFAYAFYYFFYYRKQVCEFDEQNHVFFINNLVHIWIIFGSTLIFYFPTMYLNINRLQSGNEQSWLVAYVRQRAVALVTTINTFMSDQQSLGLYTLFLMLSLAVYVLRFLYFLWTSKCTWYAWFVSWIFLHAHIGIVLLALPGLNFLMQRLKMQKSVQSSFVEKFSEGLSQVNPTEESEAKENSTSADAQTPPNMSKEEACRLGETYFAETLLSAMLIGFFTDLSTLKQEREDQKKKDQTEGKSVEENDIEDQELYMVFNLVLQSDLLEMTEQDAQDQETDREDNSQEKEMNEHKDDEEVRRRRKPEQFSNDSASAAAEHTAGPAESPFYDHDKLD
jgi:hypothetical protein